VDPRMHRQISQLLLILLLLALLSCGPQFHMQHYKTAGSAFTGNTASSLRMCI
jgi:hypothetical protein